MNFLGSPRFLPRPKARLSREARPHPGVLARAASPTGESGGLGETRQPPGSARPQLPAVPSGLSPSRAPLPSCNVPGIQGEAAGANASPAAKGSRCFHSCPAKGERGQAAARGRPGPAWCRHLEEPNFPAGTGPTSCPPSSLPASLLPLRQPVCPPGGDCPPHPPASPGPPRRGGDARPRHSLCCRAEGRTEVPGEAGGGAVPLPGAGGGAGWAAPGRAVAPAAPSPGRGPAGAAEAALPRLRASSRLLPVPALVAGRELPPPAGSARTDVSPAAAYSLQPWRRGGGGGRGGGEEAVGGRGRGGGREEGGGGGGGWWLAGSAEQKAQPLRLTP